VAKDSSLWFNFMGKDVSVSDTLNKIGNHAKSTSEKLDKASKSASLVLGAVAGAAILSAKAAMEDEASQTKLATTLSNVTNASSKQKKAVEDYISTLTLSSGIADDELRPSLDRLIRSTHSITEAQKLQGLAMNISAGTGKSLAQVSEALAKAHDGNFASLKKLGVTLDATILKHKDFNGAAKVLGETFKGQLDKQVGTSAGQMKVLKNALNEAKETVGYALLPAIKGLMGAFKAIAPFINENKDLIIKAVEVVALLAAAVVTVNYAFKAYTATMKAWSVLQKVWTGLQAAWNVVVAANPIMLIVIGVAALIAVVVLLYKNFEPFRNLVNGAFEGLKNVVMGVFDWLKNNWPLVLAIITGPIGLAVRFIIDHWDTIIEGFKSLPNRLKNIGVGIVNAITAPFRTAFAFIAKIWNATIGGMSFTIPDWVPGIGGKGFNMPKLPENIPALAKGGIVSRPTLALIGENGPEAVVPLGRGGMGGGGIHIHVAGSVVTERDLAVAVRDNIAQLMRRRGLDPAILGV